MNMCDERVPARIPQPSQAGWKDPTQRQLLQSELDQAGRRRLAHPSLPGPLQARKFAMTVPT